MSEINWKEKWQENYEGKGECEGLEKRVKQIFKKDGITLIAIYLPWAVVDRIFMFQDGTTEVIHNTKHENLYVEDLDNPELPAKTVRVVIGNTIVEVDRLHIKDDIDEDSGVVTPKYMNSYFINLKATWMGREHIERYPLLSNTNQPLSFWSQADLNRAFQRAKVKAIAIVSGIGYKLFEDGDLQFADDKDDDNDIKKETATEKAKRLKEEEKVKKAEKKAKREAKKLLEKEKLGSVMDGAGEEEPKEPTKVKEEPKPVVEEKEEKTEEKEVKDLKVVVPEKRDDVENEIKRIFLTGGQEKASEIKAFLKENTTTKVTELSDKKVKELYVLVK